MVRHAEPDRDGAPCAAIYGTYVRDSFVSFEQDAPTVAEMTRRIERISATHPWLVVECDGQVAGFAYASPHRERAAYRWAVDVAVYVAAGRQGQGLGRQLYDALLPLLRHQGYHVACAGIALPNDDSISLHEALGFEPVGVYRAIGYKAGEWRDVGWWQRRLVPLGDDGPPPEPLSRPSPTNGSRRSIISASAGR
jgi:phosphinothricin acetyltransferase